MSNLIGQTLLNQFRVDAFIASGGMGAVYRVWDLKRNAPLAMKVLHADLAEDLSIFKRFQREANALKKLAHPNIVPFYGLFQTLDITFILQNFIDGPSLKDVLKQRKGRSLSVGESITYLKTLCSALGYAHSYGVVHCDVKPGNVMLDRSGSIYLADFGIARHTESTTTTLGAVGTPAYMAPEQIRSEPVSPATDVYALGVMLFEMLTGQRPFRGTEAGTESAGPTAGERIRYAHLHLPPPDPRVINPAISKELTEVVLVSLSKEPARRYHTTRDFYAAVCAATGVDPEGVVDRVAPISPPVQAYEPGLAGSSPGIPTPIAGKSKVKYPWLAGGGVLLFIIGGIAFAAIMAIIFLGNRSRQSSIQPWEQKGVSNPSPIPIQSFSGATMPVISLTKAVSSVSPPSTDSSTSEPPPTSATSAPLPPTVKVGPQEPSGKIVYTCQVHKDPNNDQICLMYADGSGKRQLIDNSYENFYASLAPDGNSIVFSSKRGTTIFDIYETDLQGNTTRLTSGIGDLYAPEISPDGRYMVFTNNYDDISKIWVMNRDGSDPHEIYKQPGTDALDPSWSSDGKYILFAVGSGEDRRLYIINKDGTHPKIVSDKLITRGRSDWSPDGHTLAAYTGGSWHHEISLINTDGSNLHQISSGGNVLAPSFSPDGNWIAFMGYIDRFGDDNGCEIYIMRVDGSDIRRLTNNDYCDWQPRWGP